MIKIQKEGEIQKGGTVIQVEWYGYLSRVVRLSKQSGGGNDINIMQFQQVASDRGYIHEQSKQYSIFQCDNYSNNQENQQQMANIPMSFKNDPYPTEFTHSNPFCPSCGKYISCQSNFLVYKSLRKKKDYLVHSQCLQKEDRICLIVSNSPQTKLQSISYLNQIRSLALGGKEFYFQIQVFHPLGGKSLTKLWTKLKSIGSNITWDFKADAEADCFSPNIVAFPFPDFQMSVTLIQLGEKQGKYVKKGLISVGRLGNEVQFVKAYAGDLEVTMRIISSKEEKLKTVDEMNLKYRYPLETGTAMVEIVRVQVKLPSDDSDEDDFEFSKRTLSIPELESEKHSFRDARSFHNSEEALSQRSFDREKVDLEKLIASEQLADFVRQNTQSRVFQTWLSEASPREVDEIISSLWEEIPDLITHEYANYMVQKLIGVCSLPQRIRLVQRLQSDIPGIARNKQGTHSLQTLITLFSTDEEYRLATESIQTSFLILAQHPNATHFLQKIISLFPLSQTSKFVQTVTQDFISFALDKHAMCVVKQMIKKVAQCEGNSKESLAHELRKRFIHVVNFNIGQLIGDPYGNYIIQFCFELFGEEKCGAITERIIDKFLQFSLQRYSSAVLFKCISQYWTSKDTLNRLKNGLSHQTVDEMFRNKQSNKILLQIVQKHEGSPLRQKIQNILMLNAPTKFNHERWGSALGPRSGNVGGYTSFSHAAHKHGKKKYRKHNNNDK